MPRATRLSPVEQRGIPISSRSRSWAPHPEWGEVPVAFLVVESPFDEGTEAALVAYCKSQMAGFKVPRRFEYLAALPRNALGKVQKHLLPG